MGVSGRRFHDRYAPELTFSGVKTLSRGATTRHLPAAARTRYRGTPSFPPLRESNC